MSITTNLRLDCHRHLTMQLGCFIFILSRSGKVPLTESSVLCVFSYGVFTTSFSFSVVLEKFRFLSLLYDVFTTFSCETKLRLFLFCTLNPILRIWFCRDHWPNFEDRMLRDAERKLKRSQREVKEKSRRSRWDKPGRHFEDWMLRDAEEKSRRSRREAKEKPRKCRWDRPGRHFESLMLR